MEPRSLWGTALSWVSGLSASSAPDLAPDPFNPAFWGAMSAASLAGQTVTAESALQLDVVQSVLERLGGTISTLPMMVFERTGENSREVARDHPLFKVLHRQPNARQTAQEYRDEQQRQLAFYRNCLSLIHPAADGSPVGSLEPVHWSRVQRVFMGTDEHVYYEVRRLGMAAGADTYRDDEVWHIRKAPLSTDGLVGMPVYQTSRETLGTAQAVRQFGALYFKNGGAGGGVLKHPGNFKSTDDRDAFLESWRSGGQGLNRHKDRLLLFGVDYTPFAVNNDEAQFNETKTATAVDIARIWNMPPHMVGLMDKATFSNIEQQSIEYVVHTLAPWVAAWEQAAARDLLIGSDQDRFFIELNVAGLLRGDIKTRYMGYAQGRQWGWFSVNDIRRFENLDPIGPDGDRYLEPVNMTPAGTPAGMDTGQTPPANDDADPADRNDDPEDT